MPPKTKQKRKPTPPVSMPQGFEEVSTGRIDGWYVLEEANTVQGTIVDSFAVEGQFGPKRVYKIQITAGRTKVIDMDRETAYLTEGVVGVDEKGFLKGLSDLQKGQEVYIACLGKDPPSKDYPNGAWKFTLGAKPLSASQQRAKQEAAARQGKEDNIPF